MDGTMKRLMFKTKGQVELIECPIPSYGDDGLLVKVAYAGICGSDVHAYTKGGLAGGIGDNKKFGHEFAGTVVEVGKNVKDFKEGDRVWIDPNYCEPEGSMASCQAGGFSEYCGTLQAIKDVSVFKIPDDLPLRSASLIEPFGVGVHTKNRIGVKPGDRVVMWGAGPIGMMGWAAMKHAGVEDIVVAERMPERIEFARNLGADVFDNSEDDVCDYAAEKFGTVTIVPDAPDFPDVDKYIDYVGAGFIIQEYMQDGRPLSVLSTLGIDMTPVEIYPGFFMTKELTVKGSRGYQPEDIKEVIEVLRDKDIDIASVISNEFTLDEYQKAFDTASNRNNGMKTIFRIGGED